MYLRGKNWITEFWHNGIRYKKALGKGISKTVAKERAEKFKREVREGIHQDKAKRIMFEKFVEKYLDHARVNKRPKSAKRNEVSIKQMTPYFKGQLIGTIHPFQVEQYKKARRDGGASPATVNRDVACLKNIMNCAVDWNYLRVNPISRVKLFKEDNERMWVLRQEEEVRLLDQCARSPQRGGKENRYLRDLAEFALHSGMRQQEIFSLLKVNVHIDENYLTVVDSKTHQGRPVPLNETLKKILQRRMEKPGDHVCVFRGKCPGVPGESVHPFRGYPSTCSKGKRPGASERSDAGGSYFSESLFFVKFERSFLMESPLRLILCALCTRRSRMASAMVASLMLSCH